ncbi:DUF6924 domain-containing protein [Nocardia altamirensis]|uniref:DUF6924 domain-containing protein n=1 Tax=Nocardia altamirensis TaxID=472158 RepID=UPI0008404E36|nr:hypothetical protein [Nocardia altamirensis]
MSYPKLPQPHPGEVLLVCTSYDDDTAHWGDLLDGITGRREGDVLIVGDSGVRLRLIEDWMWDSVRGGHFPARLPRTSSPPFIIVGDSAAAYGTAPLLVDLAVIPGRGVRVPLDRLGEILSTLLSGTLTFDHLVSEIDVHGTYQGNGGRPAFPALPTAPRRVPFPKLPSTDGVLLVRTFFGTDEGWHTLLDELGGVDDQGWVGADTNFDETDTQFSPLTALTIDHRAFKGLLPGHTPALVPGHAPTTLLADARTFTQPDRPLLAVDLRDAPGRHTVLPRRMVGLMAGALEIGEADFDSYVAMEGVKQWWEKS